MTRQAYLGTGQPIPLQIIPVDGAPASSDAKNVSIGDEWLNTSTDEWYKLSSLDGGAATWSQFVSATGWLDTIDTDSGSAITDDSTITLAGDATQGISTSGAASTVTITAASASTSQKGTVELATNAETIAYASTTLVTTPANIGAAFASPAAIGSTTAAAGTFTTATITTANITTGNITTADINGGAIDGTTIGGSSAAAGTFTTCSASSFVGGTIAGTTGTLSSTLQAVSNVNINDTEGTPNTIVNINANSDVRNGMTISIPSSGAQAGSDARVAFSISGGESYVLGIDNSASDAFVGSIGLVPGTSNFMSVSSSGTLNYPLQPWVLAIDTSTQSNVTGDSTVWPMVISSEIKDQSGSWASNTFTAPVTGGYTVCIAIDYEGITTAHTYGYVRIVTSNRTYEIDELIDSSTPVSGFDGISASLTVDMDAADTCSFSFAVFGGTKVIDVSTIYASIVMSV